MSRLAQRLARLEKARGVGESKLWVVVSSPEESDAAALARLGATPQPHDLVVFIRR